jgi:hypothetical protein
MISGAVVLSPVQNGGSAPPHDVTAVLVAGRREKNSVHRSFFAFDGRALRAAGKFTPRVYMSEPAGPSRRLPADKRIHADAA